MLRKICQGTSNEYAQHMHLWRIKKNINTFCRKEGPYLELCNIPNKYYQNNSHTNQTETLLKLTRFVTKKCMSPPTSCHSHIESLPILTVSHHCKPIHRGDTEDANDFLGKLFLKNHTFFTRNLIYNPNFSL